MPNKISLAVESTLRRTGLVGRRLVVGVSGGTDSLALLGGVQDVRDALDLDPVIAHFDHGLRPESGDDADFVKSLGERLGVATHVGLADVGAFATGATGGIEEAARHARYAFFAGVVDATVSAAVLVGHTATDQTETRLMHVVRGTGLRGLRGMAADSVVTVPSGQRVRVVRPLLGCTRDETASFCAAHGLEPRVDSSNEDLAFTRNRLRHQVVGSLRQINPRLDDALDRLATVAADAEEFLEGELESRLPSLVRRTAETWQIDRRGWASLPDVLKRALLRRAAAAITPNLDVGYDAVEGAVIAIDRWSAGTTLDWPGRRTIVVSHDWAVVAGSVQDPLPLEPVYVNTQEESTTRLDCLPDALPRDGRAVEVAGTATFWLRIRPRQSTCDDRWGDRWHVDLDRGRLGDAPSLLIRSRRPGDFLLPAGSDGRKKIQDLLVDAHVPRQNRDRIPIVSTTDGRIAWAVGLRGDRRFLANRSCANVLCLDVIQNEKGGIRD